MKEEIWKDIYFIENGIEYDYRGLYQVSNFGNIKKINKNKEKILKLEKRKDGYTKISLYKNNKIKKFYVHRLVAFMFIPNPNNLLQVDHIIPIKNGGNNNIDNLRWVTAKENSNNEITKQNYSNAKRNENHSQIRVIAQYDLNGNLIKVWDYMKQASIELGIDQSAISKCCRGKLKTTGGFIFR